MMAQCTHAVLCGRADIRRLATKRSRVMVWQPRASFLAIIGSLLSLRQGAFVRALMFEPVSPGTIRDPSCFRYRQRYHCISM
eukprot:SAG31_NODE_3622_length_4059_cov_2.742905_3_plen_82_part_00